MDKRPYGVEVGFILYGKVTEILSKVNMIPKVIVTSREESQEAIDKLAEKILSHIWKAKEDINCVQACVQPVPKAERREDFCVHF